MKKLIYLVLSVFFVLACNTIKDSALDTEANNKRFTKRIETFKNYSLSCTRIFWKILFTRDANVL